MKVALVGIAGIPLGKHKVKDPRLDEAGKLVKADKKLYASVDVAGEQEVLTADAIVASPEGRFDLIVKDLEFVQTRLGRNRLRRKRRCSRKSRHAWRIAIPWEAN